MLTKEEARLAIYDDLEGWEVVHDEIVGHGRWDVTHECILKHDGKFYRTYYSKGATEQQDVQAFEYEEPEFEEVFPCEVKTLVYMSQQEIQKKGV